MKRAPTPNERFGRSAVIKAALLLIFLIAAICLLQYPPLNDRITAQSLVRLLDTAGPWAPLLFILIYATSLCLLVPGTFLAVMGAMVFGTILGFLYTWMAAMTAAGASFLIGRTLGRDLSQSIIGDRLKRYDDAIQRNGFVTVLYLRLVNFPFAPLNYGMGLTKIRFWDFFAATGLGVLFGIFILTFLGGVLREFWATGNWQVLMTPRFYISVALLGFSLIVPVILYKLRNRRT
jgi:uncharacterized membrane protein YdjX (TVP38/TMEM64 family)